ncbi:hypothetical protein [Actinoallomurus sp. NPDC052274]|uniref:hypothetical protein n=1 Tax=Actinoallomurus sp. NPDC052274 TaxID=3155420 RepID=UPI00341F719F
MDDLIEALTILRKYGNRAFPTYCRHDELWIAGVQPADVSEEDKTRLDELGFIEADDAFMSHRFGSC